MEGRESVRDPAVLHITRYRGSTGKAGEESIVKHKKDGQFLMLNWLVFVGARSLTQRWRQHRYHANLPS